MQNKSIIVVVTMGFVLAGCANTSGAHSDAEGSIIGATKGAAISTLLFGKVNKSTASRTRVEAKANYVWSQEMENQKRQMQTATAGIDVRVSNTADNRLKLNIPNDIAFDIDHALIKPKVQPILDFFADSLIQNSDTYVTITGHMDNSNNDVINNPLSFDHATSRAINRRVEIYLFELLSSAFRH